MGNINNRAVADLGGGAPRTDQNFFNFIGFFGKSIKLLGRRPPPSDWCPLLGEVLDPPLPRACRVASHSSFTEA